MPQCVVCKSWLSPILFSEDETAIKKCVFCVRGQDKFESGNIDEGFTLYDREVEKKKYLDFLNNASRKPNIAKYLVNKEEENETKI
jgi:hypothetical protein